MLLMSLLGVSRVGPSAWTCCCALVPLAGVQILAHQGLLRCLLALPHSLLSGSSSLRDSERHITYAWQRYMLQAMLVCIWQSLSIMNDTEQTKCELLLWRNRGSSADNSHCLLLQLLHQPAAVVAQKLAPLALRQQNLTGSLPCSGD